jgi:hypothetical protein
VKGNKKHVSLLRKENSDCRAARVFFALDKKLLVGASLQPGTWSFSTWQRFPASPQLSAIVPLADPTQSFVLALDDTSDHNLWAAAASWPLGDGFTQLSGGSGAPTAITEVAVAERVGDRFHPVLVADAPDGGGAVGGLEVVAPHGRPVQRARRRSGHGGSPRALFRNQQVAGSTPAGGSNIFNELHLFLFL